MASNIFLLTSFTYTICLIVLRFSANFDAFNSRLLIPGTVFLYFGLVLKLNFEKAKNYKFEYILLLLLSILLILPYYYDKLIYLRTNSSLVELGFEKKIETLENKYAEVNENSIVLWADRDILYRRIDIARIEPEKAPNYHQETLEMFLIRISVYERVYIDLNQLKIDLVNHKDDYHPSIYEYFCEYLNRSGNIIKLDKR